MTQSKEIRGVLANNTPPARRGFTPGEVKALLEHHFPQASEGIGPFEIDHCGDGAAHVRMPFDDRFARPGGTISGPTMFKLVDLGAYVAILGVRGDEAVDAVTSTLTINFLARPQPADLYAVVETLRQGRRQWACEARVYSGEERLLVAQASCIYAMPGRATS